MITLLAWWPALVARLAGAHQAALTLTPALPWLCRRTSELAGFGCALVFAHQVWPPLLWAAAALLLILLGQER